MNNSLELRRRWLFGAAGASAILVTTPAVADMRAQASPNKKADAENTRIPVTEDLMREHGVLDRLLLIYETGARRLGQGEDIAAGLFTQAAEIMRDFVHGYHEKAEEEEIFPHFKKAGRMVELVGILETQHDAGRKLTDKVLAAAPGIANTDQRKAMIDAMQAAVVLYRPHMAREDTELFPTLRSIVTPSEFDALAETMEKEESAKLGGDGFEKAVKTIEAIEKRLGTKRPQPVHAEDLTSAPPASARFGPRGTTTQCPGRLSRSSGRALAQSGSRDRAARVEMAARRRMDRARARRPAA